MPSPRPQPSTAPHSDESMVVTVLACVLLAVLVFGIGGYQFWQYQREQAQHKTNSKAYRSYVRHTDAAPAPAPLPPALQESLDMGQRLLAHPGVTPGIGFSAPGVKSTGIVIIDAIDQAQSRERLGEL